MTTYITLVPAYGRDYKSAKVVKEDFKSNKDFEIADVMHPDCGRKTNLGDAVRFLPEDTVFNIRFDQMRKICVVKVSEFRKFLDTKGA